MNDLICLGVLFLDENVVKIGRMVVKEDLVNEEDKREAFIAITLVKARCMSDVVIYREWVQAICMDRIVGTVRPNSTLFEIG